MEAEAALTGRSGWVGSYPSARGMESQSELPAAEGVVLSSLSLRCVAPSSLLFI